MLDFLPVAVLRIFLAGEPLKCADLHPRSSRILFSAGLGGFFNQSSPFLSPCLIRARAPCRKFDVVFHPTEDGGASRKLVGFAEAVQIQLGKATYDLVGDVVIEFTRATGRHLRRQSQPAVAGPLDEDRDGWIETLRVGGVVIGEARGDEHDFDAGRGEDGGLGMVWHVLSVAQFALHRTGIGSRGVKLK